MGARLTLIAILVTAPVAFGHGSTMKVTLQLDSYRAGKRPAHHLTFDVRAGGPEIFLAVLEYPEAFRFNGFRPNGSAITPVGAYDLDLDFDGTPERSLPLLALDSASAYVDVFGDGIFSPATDPLFRHTGAARFELRLPLGGDASPETRVALFAARVTLSLSPGLVITPGLGGHYQVIADLTTVDPDTDGPDDGRGEAPVTSRFQVPIVIVGPSVVPFARLSVDTFDLKQDGQERSRFFVRGRYVPGHWSNGFDFRTDNVTVTIDWLKPGPPRCMGRGCGRLFVDRHALPVEPTRAFSQTVSGSAFDAAGHAHHFRGNPPGIERFWLWPDGRFQIDIRELTLMDSARVAAFTLAIGNDRGTTTMAVGGTHHDRW